MKKYLVLLFFSIMICLSGYAQKGRQGVGVNCGTSYFNEYTTLNWCGGLKYENFLTDYIRLTPSIEYRSAASGYGDLKLFSIKAKSDFFLSSIKRVRPYLHVGIGYTWGEEEADYNSYTNPSAINLRAGIGLDWRIAYALSLQFEVAYNYVTETLYRHYDFGIGLTYYFK